MISFPKFFVSKKVGSQKTTPTIFILVIKVDVTIVGLVLFISVHGLLAFICL